MADTVRCMLQFRGAPEDVAEVGDIELDYGGEEEG